jgi:uncharacterized protein YdaU (DUF1376 family)
MPLYITDYEADTGHLSPEEDGIYMRLLRLCWRTPGCSIPTDPDWVARMMRVTPAYYAERVTPILEEFFKVKSNRFYQPRQTLVYQKAKYVSEVRSLAGKNGGRPRKPLENGISYESKPLSNAKANGNHLDLDLELIKKEGKADFQGSQKQEKVPPEYPWNRNITFGENQTRAALWQWAKSRTRPPTLTGPIASHHLREMASLLTAAELAWLKLQKPEKMKEAS